MGWSGLHGVGRGKTEKAGSVWTGEQCTYIQTPGYSFETVRHKKGQCLARMIQ